MAAAKLKKKKGHNASKRASVAAWLFSTKSYSPDVEVAQTDDSSANSETGVGQPQYIRLLHVYSFIRFIYIFSTRKLMHGLHNNNSILMLFVEMFIIYYFSELLMYKAKA